MYEPCNTIELSTEEEAAEGSNYLDAIRYIFPPPESLDKYVGGFTSHSSAVLDLVNIVSYKATTNLSRPTIGLP
jgi:hypothetical protein